MSEFIPSVIQNFHISPDQDDRKLYQFLVDNEGSLNISYEEGEIDKYDEVEMPKEVAIALRNFLNYCYPKP